MELLSFKIKIFELLGIQNTEEIGEKLLEVVLNNKTEVFDSFKEIADDRKDWLQALWQYYEADRSFKKQDFTPKSLCKLISALVGECKSIYDCCGGSGALTLQNLKDKSIEKVYIEELDSRVVPFLLFNLCLHNASGTVVNGNALTGEKYKTYRLSKGKKYSAAVEAQKENSDKTLKFDCSISNPPFNIRWQPPAPLEMDKRFPVIPPANNANWAFAFNCISKADKAVLILPNGVTSENSEKEVRKYLIDEDLVELVAIMPDRMFEATSISTCIVVLNKNKQKKGVVKFIDSRKNCIVEEREQNGQFGSKSHTARTYKKQFNALSEDNISKIINAPESEAEFSATKTIQEIAESDYLLTPSRYIEFKEQESEHRPFQDIADNLNYILRQKNACKLVINETIARSVGLDAELFVRDREASKRMKVNMAEIGIKLEADDYIQSTKNKNEFVFKCNDKELLPEIMLEFLSLWKNRIILLNSMENQYLAELIDALLPDLMSGKIDLGAMKDDEERI